jgi:lipoprotein-anchoring transpeptidase ErfK/SrfK
LSVGRGGLVPNVILANPIPEAIAYRIDEFKQAGKDWIEIDLSEQHLIAWEGEKQTFTTIISTGKSTTPTQPGIYNIQRKLTTDRMRGADYDIPDVPHVLYYDRGYALHGAYWHNSFGTPISHGCINLPVNKAQWLFTWTNIGTPVVIHD